MDYKTLLFRVLRDYPKEIKTLEALQNKEAILEVLPYAPACYLHLDKSLRADKDILIAALSDVLAPKENDELETEQERNVRALVVNLFGRKQRSDDWYDYHAYTKQWQSKVPAALRKNVVFITKALEANLFAAQLIEHELSQEPKFLVKLAELYGIRVFALCLDGELLKKATMSNKPGDFNIEDSVAQDIYEELKARLEKKSLEGATPPGTPSTKQQFKL